VGDRCGTVVIFNYMKSNKILTFSYLARNISIVLGLVLIWRGIWYVLDGFDLALFGGNHMLSAIAGIIIGLIILYIPDKDLKEIGKL